MLVPLQPVAPLIVKQQVMRASEPLWARHSMRHTTCFLFMYNLPTVIAVLTAYSHSSLRLHLRLGCISRTGTAPKFWLFWVLLLEAAMQAVGLSPNVASAEALLQSCQGCTHLSGKVDILTAPFQPALMAARLLPRAATAQTSSPRGAAEPAPAAQLPSADILPASPAEKSTEIGSSGTDLAQPSGAGQLAADPDTVSFPGEPRELRTEGR